MLGKIVLALLGFGCFGTSLVWAAATQPLPANQCAEAPCTAPQQRIWNQFEAGGALSSLVIGKVSSGSCYHRSSHMDPNHEHYGVIFLDSFGTDIFMNGQFGFFYTANPYATWTPKDAIKELSPAHKPEERMTFENGYAWANENPKPPPLLLYFLRQTGEVIYLYGYFGVDWNLFCELKPNPAN